MPDPEDPQEAPPLTALPAALPVTTVAARLDNARTKAERLLEDARNDHTGRAQTTDLAYFWSWAEVAFGLQARYPAPIELIYAFVSEHLNGLDPAVDQTLIDLGIKKQPGPHKLATVRRRLSTLAQQHRARAPALDPRHVYHPEIVKLLKAARQQPRHRPAQKDAITRERLWQLIAPIDPATRRGLQQRAILAVAFASGGRRRSELVRLEVRDVHRWTDEAPPGYYFTLRLRGTKTHAAATLVPEVPVCGQAAVYLQAWLTASGLTEGRLFRRVLAGDRLAASLSAEAVRLLVKSLQAKAGLTALDLSAHSLRAGFVTQCALDNVPAVEGRALSLHRSESTYNRYYRAGSLKENRASRLLAAARDEASGRDAPPAKQAP